MYKQSGPKVYSYQGRNFQGGSGGYDPPTPNNQTQPI